MLRLGQVRPDRVEPVEHHLVHTCQGAGVGVFPGALLLGQGDAGGWRCDEGFLDPLGLTLQEGVVLASMIRVGARI